DQPLRLIGDWVEDVRPGRGEARQTRQTLLTSVKAWLSSGGEAGVALRCLPLILSPDFRLIFTDPGSSGSVSFTRGLLTAEEIESIGSLWEECLEVVRSVEQPNWDLALDVVRLWAFPDPSFASAGCVAPELDRVMRSIAIRMVTDLVTLAEGHPGVLH